MELRGSWTLASENLSCMLTRNRARFLLGTDHRGTLGWLVLKLQTPRQEVGIQCKLFVQTGENLFRSIYCQSRELFTVRLPDLVSCQGSESRTNFHACRKPGADVESNDS